MRQPFIATRPGAIHEACRALDMSRDALARRLGVSSSALYRIESDRARPGTKVIAALMIATGKDFDDLFEIRHHQDAEVAS